MTADLNHLWSASSELNALRARTCAAGDPSNQCMMLPRMSGGQVTEPSDEASNGPAERPSSSHGRRAPIRPAENWRIPVDGVPATNAASARSSTDGSTASGTLRTARKPADLIDAVVGVDRHPQRIVLGFDPFPEHRGVTRDDRAPRMASRAASPNPSLTDTKASTSEAAFQAVISHSGTMPSSTRSVPSGHSPGGTLREAERP